MLTHGSFYLDSTSNLFYIKILICVRIFLHLLQRAISIMMSVMIKPFSLFDRLIET